MVKKKSIIMAVAGSIIISSPIFCMQSPGMQEIAKYRAEFQVGLKKLQNLISIENWDNTDHSDADKAFFNAQNKEMRNRAQTIAKELEAAFNDVSAKSESYLQPSALLQDADYKAIDNYIKEIKDVQYTYDLGTPRRIDACREQQRIIVAGWQKITEALARIEKPAQLQPAISIHEHESLANTLAQVRTQLQEKTIATYELAGLNSTKESAIRSLEGRLQEKEREIAQLRQQSLLASAQSQDLQKRMVSMLALFEASKTTGWEAAFVQGLKKELGKLG